MRRRYFIFGLIMAAGLSLLFAFVQKRHGEFRCSLDGSIIQPLYGVEIMQGDESTKRFCCVLNAQIWLQRNVNPVSCIWVIDEITGTKVRADEAFYVSSTVISTPHTGNRIHVFAEKQAARIHARQFDGKLVANPLRLHQKQPAKIATYMPDSSDNAGFAQTSSQKPLYVASDAAWVRDLNHVGTSHRYSSRLSMGYSKPLDKPPQSFS